MLRAYQTHGTSTSLVVTSGCSSLAPDLEEALAVFHMDRRQAPGEGARLCSEPFGQVEEQARRCGLVDYNRRRGG